MQVVFKRVVLYLSGPGPGRAGLVLHIHAVVIVAALKRESMTSWGSWDNSGLALSPFETTIGGVKYLSRAVLLAATGCRAAQMLLEHTCVSVCV